MKTKSKNPLYVVKGNDVEEATGIFDLVVKKFDLGPIIEFLGKLFKMLLDEIKSYPTFVAIKNTIDEIVVTYFGFIKKFGLA